MEMTEIVMRYRLVVLVSPFYFNRYSSSMVHLWFDSSECFAKANDKDSFAWLLMLSFSLFSVVYRVPFCRDSPGGGAGHIPN